MMEEKVREAIILELERQAQSDPGKLKVSARGEGLTAHGEINLAALAMAIVGAVSGGP